MLLKIKIQNKKRDQVSELPGRCAASIIQWDLYVRFDVMQNCKVPFNQQHASLVQDLESNSKYLSRENIS